MEIHETIKHIREKSGYSQKEFANEVKCSQAIISQCELGNRKPGYEILKNISDFAKRHKIKINLL